MTKDASFKKVVRRHAEETGQLNRSADGSRGSRCAHGPCAPGLPNGTRRPKECAPYRLDANRDSCPEPSALSAR